MAAQIIPTRCESSHHGSKRKITHVIKGYFLPAKGETVGHDFYGCADCCNRLAAMHKMTDKVQRV